MYRRDFLAVLAAGTGAVLMGRGWYRQELLLLPVTNLNRRFRNETILVDGRTFLNCEFIDCSFVHRVGGGLIAHSVFKSTTGRGIHFA